MDRRQQAQDYSGGNPQRVGATYGFNGIQNDPFHTFVNTDNDSAFESSWSNQPVPAQQQHINGFDEGNHGWQQTPYQSSNFLGAANYGHPREYEQPYSRSPSSFNYPSFDPSHNQTFAPHPYEPPPNPYEDPLYGSLNNNAQFEYPGPAGLQQHHDTISPQALQTYPSAFAPPATDDNHQVCSITCNRNSDLIDHGSLITLIMAQICLCGEVPRLDRPCILAQIGLALQVRHHPLSPREVCISSPLQGCPMPLSPPELTALSLLVTARKPQVPSKVACRPI